MKRFLYALIVVSAMTIVLPRGLAFAQKSVPQVPITYAGDTDKTIARRAQWIENAKKEGNLVRWGSDEAAAMKEITSEFNKIYPYIKVSYWRGQGAETTTRLETEHSINRVSVDVCDAEEIQSYPHWRKIGLVDRLTDFMPGIEKRDKRTYSKDGDWAILGDNPFAPSYNIKLVSAAEAPKRWEDLLNPQWKGKKGMAILERVAGRSSAAPGAGTRLSRALEGLPLVYRTEEVVMKVAELNIVDRFSKILGITAE